jgi:hemolysin III
MLVFGFGLVTCFLGSTLFHAVRLPEPEIELFATLDYIGIFLLIAGTCTPIVFTMLTGVWRWGPLLWVWAFALTGIILRVLEIDLPPSLSTGMYLGMGWGMLSCFPGLVRVVPHRPLMLVPLGGALYSVGAAFYLSRWPTLWPGVFGSHELLHLFVMGGSLTHYLFVLKYVVPYERVPAIIPVPEELPLGGVLVEETAG